MLWGRGLWGRLALGLAMFVWAPCAQAAPAFFSFSGTLETPIADQGIAAGTSFSGMLAFDRDTAPFTSFDPLRRVYNGSFFSLVVEGATGPGPLLPAGTLISANTPSFDPGGDIQNRAVVTSQDFGISSLNSGGGGQWSALMTVFGGGSPDLRLPSAGNLSSFTLAFVDFGNDGITLPYRGIIEEIAEVPAAVPIPPAAWLFLTALAGLAIMRYKRH